jgi:Rad3-related DNA helicase
MSLLLDISPPDLGLPPKFTSFRSAQADAIDFILSASEGWIAAHAPTGVGKSLVGVTVAKVLDLRAAYLTSTKALQNQVAVDFKLGQVKGRANYTCRSYTDCAEGSQRGCSRYDTTGCPYSAAYFKACDSGLIPTNYSFWMYVRRSSAGSGLCKLGGKPIELLICDEAHHIFQELASFMAVRLPESEYDDALKLLPQSKDGLMSEPSGSQWRIWAAIRVTAVNAEMRELKEKFGTAAEARAKSNYADLERLIMQLKSIQSFDQNWTWEFSDTAPRSVSFDPIWPGQYAHLLWSGVPQVLLLSATLCKYTLQLLGLPKNQYAYREFKNGWPPNHALNWYVPTARMTYKSTEEDHRKMALRIDEIIAGRLDRKGIIHTVSYQRMRQIMAASKYRKYMVNNENSRDSTKVAAAFKAAKAPCILVSPSFSTGWDFPFSECEYQILPKVPFPYAESRVMKERNKDERYRIYCAILEIIQMIGRGRRAEFDRCETFILDNNFPRVMAKGKEFAPQGFQVHRSLGVPKAPAKLMHVN